MSAEDNQFETLNVRVVAQPPARKAVYRTTYYTVVLQAADGLPEPLLAASDDRVCAYVTAMDDDVVIHGNRNDAQKGAGAIIAKRLAAPFPLQDSAAVWCAVSGAMAGPTSRVSVVDIHVTHSDQ